MHAPFQGPFASCPEPFSAFDALFSGLLADLGAGFFVSPHFAFNALFSGPLAIWGVTSRHPRNVSSGPPAHRLIVALRAFATLSPPPFHGPSSLFCFDCVPTLLHRIPARNISADHLRNPLDLRVPYGGTPQVLPSSLSRPLQGPRVSSASLPRQGL
jgi:hypothetical protein